MTQIITIGRGHSGTRIMSHTLEMSHVYTGNVNESGDHIPGQPMYEAVRLFGALVEGKPGAWDFSKVMGTPPPDKYTKLVSEYLAPFRKHKLYAWKLPEAALALPWLVQIFPDAYYIHWVRDGRDSILGYHGTDDDWYGVPTDAEESGNWWPEDRLTRAAMSWAYHEELIAQTPNPKNWIKVRYEDFVMNQDDELNRLEDYLRMPLRRVLVYSASIGRYKNQDIEHVLSIMEKHLWAHGYIEEFEYAD